jgi:hypothetical protein
MAIDVSPGLPARLLALFTASGNFVVPAGVTRIFASIHSASGGGGGGAATSRYGSAQTDNEGGAGGVSKIFASWVQVVPGATYAVVVGAAGAAGVNGNQDTLNGSAGGTGGTSSFDGVSFSVTGSGGGAGGTNGTNGATGADASASGVTSLSALPPTSNSIPKTGTIIVQTTSAQARGTAGVGTQPGSRYTRYSGPGPSAGQPGLVYIYV